jgi:1-acyl-sn-glycerol-3-phosphate acyltransferase
VSIPPFHWWRTVFFLIPAIAVYTIVLGALSIGSSVFDKRGYFGHWCARMWAKLILVTTGVRVDVEGLERLQPGRTYVFVSNHQSHYDTAVVFAKLPFQLRIISKDAIGRFPVLGWHLRRTGHILVDRRRPDRTAIFEWASRLTSLGLSLIVYPEGTRSVDGRVAPFKAGSFQIALQASLAIVPVSLVGTRRIMAKGQLAAHPGRVRLVIHDPIETTGLAGVDVKEFGERVRQIVRPAAESDMTDAVSSRA